MEHFLRTWQSGGLWLLWNLFSLIISNCYDGQLYSFLASESYPKAPNDLIELASSNLPIVTHEWLVHISYGRKTIGSSLRNSLVPRNTTGSQSSNAALSRVPKYYGDLAAKIHFIPGVGKPNGHTAQQILEYSTTNKSSESVFAVMDKESFVQTLDPIFDMAQGKKVIRRQVVTNFNLYRGWLIRKYIAYSHIEWVLWQIYEGGIRQFWEHNSMIIQQLSMARRSVGKSKKKCNIMAYLLGKQATNQRSAAIWEIDPNPMSATTIWGVLMMCMILIGCSTWIFVVEGIYFKLKFKMMVKVETILESVNKIF